MGFRLAKHKQGALKIAMYGPAGSGKTFTSLLISEGLAAMDGKRIAYVDTETGTGFYDSEVKERVLHPEAFDFDRLDTRALSEVNEAVSGLDPEEYSIVVIDSMTHLWEAAIEGWPGDRTSAGTIPMHAWGEIKRPYKLLISTLMNSPMHFIICGRQKNVFGDDDGDGEVRMVGVAMKAEGETAHEPHILIRMTRELGRGKRLQPVCAFFEKDRTGILAGRTITLAIDQKPGYTFDAIARPLLTALGVEGQSQVPTSEDAAVIDQSAALERKRLKKKFSADKLAEFKARFSLAATLADLKQIGDEITPSLKRRMNTKDVAAVRDLYKGTALEIKQKSGA